MANLVNYNNYINASRSRGRYALIYRLIISLFALAFPWSIRRFILRTFLGYQLGKNSRIGISFIFADHVILGEGAVIGNWNIISPLSLLQLGPFSCITDRNRVVGNQLARDYRDENDRFSALILGEHSAITLGHFIDCTNTVEVGRFVTIAGVATQILTHSPDFRTAIQCSSPCCIGDYCFIGTRSLILSGASLPSYSILAAGSVLAKPQFTEYRLYGGIPAEIIGEIPEDNYYFRRQVGRLGEG